MVPCTRLKPALSPHSKVMLEYARVLDVKKAARCLSVFHKVCVPATLNHSLKELVLPVAPTLTPDKLEKYNGHWKKDNSGRELSPFLLALVVYQFGVTDGTSSMCLNTLDYL